MGGGPTGERERNWRGFGRAPMVVSSNNGGRRGERETEKSGGERKKTLGRERKWREREREIGEWDFLIFNFKIIIF